MDKLKHFSKNAAIISILLVIIAYLFECAGLGLYWAPLTTLAPIVLQVLFVVFFCRLYQLDEKYRVASIIGILASSARLINQALAIINFCIYNYLHCGTVTLTMIGGLLIYVYYLLLLISFMILQKKFSSDSNLRAITILLPVLLIGFFVLSMMTTGAKMNDYFRCTIPYIVSSAFFFLFYRSNL